MLDVTIAIPTYNEEKNLPGCLKAIGKNFVLKVVLIDSGSTDKTIEIARENEIEVISFTWDGQFPKKRNWFLRNHTPSTKWILFLDADEYLTEDFKKELTKVCSKDDDVKGYWLRYTIYFMGKEMKGGYPLKKLALFCTGAGEYEYIPENMWSSLDMEVHEHPVISGRVENFRSKIDHRDFRGISHYVAKHSEYANWEAERYSYNLANIAIKKDWTWKQRLKYKLMGSPVIGPFYFFTSFFILAGFRDGSRGFAFAILKMSYFNQVYCKIRENKVQLSTAK